MSDGVDTLFGGLMDVLDEIEDAIEGRGDVLVGELDPARVEADRPDTVDAETLTTIAELLPGSACKALFSRVTYSLPSDQRVEVVSDIVEALSPEQQVEFLELALDVVAPQMQKRVQERRASKGEKAALIALLLWFLDKIVEIFAQKPVESVAREGGGWLKKMALKLIHPLVPELVTVPAGEFWMGTDRERLERDGVEWNIGMDEETPYHQLYLPKYHIAKHPVTNAQYAAFVQATDHREPVHWEDGKIPSGKEEHPVGCVSWHDAVDYCRWLSRVTGSFFTLPSEAEWEKAARGGNGRIYPWGGKPPTADLCNFARNVDDTTPVGKYSPEGDSPHGCADMAGNVWEWTRSLWGTGVFEPDFGYPYDPEDGREDVNASDDVHRVVRGGAFCYTADYVRCAYRGKDSPSYRGWAYGFRVVVSPFSRAQ